MHIYRQTVASCHSWSCSLGLDDDNLPGGCIPSRSANSSEIDLRNNTRALVVEDGVGLEQRLTMEREKERDGRGSKAERGARRWRDTKHPKSRGAFVVVLVVVPVVVDGWLWRDNQGYRPTSRADP